MPNDIFRWEDAGALVHHCPHCQQPLTNPRSRGKCLGHHVEWCRRYHTQLFKKSGSSSCMACRNSDEQSDQRHRNIAELIYNLKELQTERIAPSSQMTTPECHNFAAVTASASKKDRKAAKKAAKAAGRPKVFTSKEVQRIGKVLHPQEDDTEDFEKALLEDENINANLHYHRGTANTLEIRHAFIKQERSAKGDLVVEKTELDRIMAELKIPNINETRDKTARAFITAIAKAIEDDFIHVHNEDRLTMMRKGGFWRWASRKAYVRLCENNRIWDWKSEDNGLPDRFKATESGLENESQEPEPKTEDGPTEEADASFHKFRGGSIDSTDKSVPLHSSISKSSGSRNNSTSSSSRTNGTNVSSIAGGEWTVVGKPNSKPRSRGPEPKLKLTLNGGLNHLLARASPRTPKFSGFAMLSAGNEIEEDADDEEAVSPLTAVYARHFLRD